MILFLELIHRLVISKSIKIAYINKYINTYTYIYIYIYMYMYIYICIYIYIYIPIFKIDSIEYICPFNYFIIIDIYYKIIIIYIL